MNLLDLTVTPLPPDDDEREDERDRIHLAALELIAAAEGVES